MAPSSRATGKRLASIYQTRRAGYGLLARRDAAQQSRFRIIVGTAVAVQKVMEPGGAVVWGALHLASGLRINRS